jgi:hypothetical protein
MYALVYFNLLNVPPEHGQKCEEDISLGSRKPGPFGPGQS